MDGMKCSQKEPAYSLPNPFHTLRLLQFLFDQAPTAEGQRRCHARGRHLRPPCYRDLPNGLPLPIVAQFSSPRGIETYQAPPKRLKEQRLAAGTWPHIKGLTSLISAFSLASSPASRGNNRRAEASRKPQGIYDPCSCMAEPTFVGQKVI